jgi:hypothetical protein
MEEPVGGRGSVRADFAHGTTRQGEAPSEAFSRMAPPGRARLRQDLSRDIRIGRIKVS